MNAEPSDILALLEKELASCHAPVTGYFIACALVTDRGIYFGHNHEKEHPVTFTHAEDSAIGHMLANETNPRIRKIFMYAGGKVKKFKLYTPCFSCTEHLAPYVSPDVPVHLFPLAGTSHDLTVTYHEVAESYRDLPYSDLRGPDMETLTKNLQTHTLLSEKDRAFVADLAVTGSCEGVACYLTGSTTGRGGVSQLIMKKTGMEYRDIDMILASTKNPEEVEGLFESVIMRHFASFEKEIRLVPAYKNVRGVITRMYYYHCGPEKKLLDFTLSTDFCGSFSYRPYELRNWFHKLS